MNVGSWPRSGANHPPRVLVPTWVLVAMGTPLLALLTIPLLSLILKTPPSAIVRSLSEPVTREAIALSLRTSVLSTCLAAVLGTPLAYLLARKRPRVLPALEVLLDLPTVLPPAVAGLALLMAFGRRGLVGGWLATLGIQLPFTPIAVVMAQLFVAAPYFIKAATLGLSGVSRELEQAAALDGASTVETFRYVTLPLAWQGMVAGLALCWARALGEFGATIIFAGNLPGRTQTMPLAVYLGFEIDLTQALTLAAILLTLSFGILIALRTVLRGDRTDEDTRQ